MCTPRTSRRQCQGSTAGLPLPPRPLSPSPWQGHEVGRKCLLAPQGLPAPVPTPRSRVHKTWWMDCKTGADSWSPFYSSDSQLQRYSLQQEHMGMACHLPGHVGKGRGHARSTEKCEPFSSGRTGPASPCARYPLCETNRRTPTQRPQCLPHGVAHHFVSSLTCSPLTTFNAAKPRPTCTPSTSGSEVPLASPLSPAPQVSAPRLENGNDLPGRLKKGPNATGRHATQCWPGPRFSKRYRTRYHFPCTYCMATLGSRFCKTVPEHRVQPGEPTGSSSSRARPPGRISEASQLQADMRAPPGPRSDSRADGLRPVQAVGAPRRHRQIQGGTLPREQ